jgi:hypothetical protein
MQPVSQSVEAGGFTSAKEMVRQPSWFRPNRLPGEIGMAAKVFAEGERIQYLPGFMG